MATRARALDDDRLGLEVLVPDLRAEPSHQVDREVFPRWTVPDDGMLTREFVGAYLVDVRVFP